MPNKTFQIIESDDVINVARVSDLLVNRYRPDSEQVPSFWMTPQQLAKLPSHQILKIGYDLAALGIGFNRSSRDTKTPEIFEQINTLTQLAITQRATKLLLPRPKDESLATTFQAVAQRIQSNLFSHFSVVVADVPHTMLNDREFYNGKGLKKSMFSADRRDVWALAYQEHRQVA